MYDRAAAELWGEYKQWVQQKKISANLEAGWGELPSDYSRVSYDARRYYLMRDPVFKRLRVDHMVMAHTRLSWELAPWFCDPEPWEFLPQISDTGVSTSIWTDLSDWLPNWFTVMAPPVLTGGRNLTTHFRVILRTPVGEYTSKPQGIFGTLASKEWVKARVIIKKERMRFKTAGVVRGWLLKRKRRGDIPDPTDRRNSVTDFLTGEITKTNDATTVGTEYLRRLLRSGLLRSGCRAQRPLRAARRGPGARDHRRRLAIPAVTDHPRSAHRPLGRLCRRPV